MELRALVLVCVRLFDLLGDACCMSERYTAARSCYGWAVLCLDRVLHGPVSLFATSCATADFVGCGAFVIPRLSPLLALQKYIRAAGACSKSTPALPIRACAFGLMMIQRLQACRQRTTALGAVALAAPPAVLHMLQCYGYVGPGSDGVFELTRHALEALRGDLVAALSVSELALAGETHFDGEHDSPPQVAPALHLEMGFDGVQVSPVSRRRSDGSHRLTVSLEGVAERSTPPRRPAGKNVASANVGAAASAVTDASPGLLFLSPQLEQATLMAATLSPKQASPEAASWHPKPGLSGLFATYFKAPFSVEDAEGHTTLLLAQLGVACVSAECDDEMTTDVASQVAAEQGIELLYQYLKDKAGTPEDATQARILGVPASHDTALTNQYPLLFSCGTIASGTSDVDHLPLLHRTVLLQFLTPLLQPVSLPDPSAISSLGPPAHALSFTSTSPAEKARALGYGLCASSDPGLLQADRYAALLLARVQVTYACTVLRRRSGRNVASTLNSQLAGGVSSTLSPTAGSHHAETPSSRWARSMRSPRPTPMASPTASAFCSATHSLSPARSIPRGPPASPTMSVAFRAKHLVSAIGLPPSGTRASLSVGAVTPRTLDRATSRAVRALHYLSHAYQCTSSTGTRENVADVRSLLTPKFARASETPANGASGTHSVGRTRLIIGTESGSQSLGEVLLDLRAAEAVVAMLKCSGQCAATPKP